MNLTFGICTTQPRPDRLAEVIASIDALNIPQYEVMIMDGPEWITTKKNAVALHAKYDTLVLLHDYFVFDPGWYQAYEAFGYEWDVCSNPQMMIDGKRHFTDWVIWDHPIYPRYYSLPYGNLTFTKFQYQSGGYMLVKRNFLQAEPLNGSYVSGQPEDVEWSLRMRNRAVYTCNPHAIVRHNKVHRDCGRPGFPFRQEGHL